MRLAGKVTLLRPITVSFTLLAALLIDDQARANDVANLVTLGEIAAKGQPTRLFNSEGLSGAIDVNEAFQLTFDAAATRYLSTVDSSATETWRFALGGSWDISDRLALDADLNLTPRNTRVVFGEDGTSHETTATHAHGLDVDASYDLLAGVGVELALSATDYATRSRSQSIDARGDTAVWLLQWHVATGLSFDLPANSKFELTTNYYIYHHESGRAIDLTDALTLGGGVPLEPLRYAIRAAFARHLGVLKLTLSAQAGKYAAHEGWGASAGVRLQYSLSQAVGVWITANAQREDFSMFDAFSISWLGVGTRVIF